VRVLRIELDYDGTDFRGFAPQPGARTVGGELERGLSRVLGENVRVTSGARTDSGVHAIGQVVSLRTEAKVENQELKRALNALTGDDVWVRAVADAPEDFDARRSARSRCYRYRIWNASDPSIWNRRWSTHVDGNLDVEAMDTACQALLGKQDFAAFRTHRSQDQPGRGTVRRVLVARWQRDPSEPADVSFEIEADAFLRHMVRTIVGSSILVGQGKLPRTALADTLAARERTEAGPTAPAHGLTLMGIKY
jgi:tRNA pseudouridine38-40 synthase